MKKNQITHFLILLSLLASLGFSSNLMTGCGGDSENADGTAGVSGSGGAGNPNSSDNGGAGGASGGASGTDAQLNAALAANSAATLLTGGTFLSWTLKLSGSTISSVDLSSFTYDSGVMPSMGGDYVVVLSQAGTNIAAYPFEFPSTVIAETLGEESNHSERTLTGDKIAAVMFKVDQAIDKVSVIGPDGTVLLETTTLSNGTSLATVFSSVSGNMAGLRTLYGFPWIRLLTPSDSLSHIVNEWSEVDHILEPDEISPDHFALILRDVAPLSASAVTHIAFARMNSSRCAALTSGSIIVYNVDIPLDRVTVVHEAAHALTHLLNRNPRNGHWSATTRDLASHTLRHLGFNLGFVSYWQRIQTSAVSRGLSINYRGDGYRSISNSRALENGFTWNYGTYDAYEDIATFVEEVQTNSADEQTSLCTNIKNDSGPRLRNALPMIKLFILYNAGFITDNNFHSCIGHTNFRADAEGIHLEREDNTTWHLTRDVGAGYLEDQGQNFLQISAEDAVMTMSIRVKTRGGRVPPIGIYRLEDIPLDDLNSPKTGIFAADLATAAAVRTRTSSFGLIVVTNITASPQRAEGFFLMVGLRNYLGNITDNFPFGTFLFEQ